MSDLHGIIFSTHSFKARAWKTEMKAYHSLNLDLVNPHKCSICLNVNM